MYAKLFASLWDGTLGEHWEAWTTFAFMLANCDRDGFLEMTPNAIAARSRLPLEAVRRGIQILEAPDPESRTPGNEGRRLERIDENRSWGWRIVNHEKYRDLKSPESVRAGNRERQRRSRLNRKAAAEEPVTLGHAVTTETVTPVTCHAASHHTDADADAEQREDEAPPRLAFGPGGLSYNPTELAAAGPELSGSPGAQQQAARQLIQSVSSGLKLVAPARRQAPEVERAWELTAGQPEPVRRDAVRIVQRLRKLGIRDALVLDRLVLHLVEHHAGIRNLWAYYQPKGEGFEMLKRAMSAAINTEEHRAILEAERAWLAGGTA